MRLTLGSWLDGYIEADPVVAGVLIGAVAVGAAAYLAIRARRGRRGGAP